MILCVASLLLISLTRVLAVAVYHMTKNRFRPIIYSYAAAVLYIPGIRVAVRIGGNELSLLGIYLPILITEPAIVKRMNLPNWNPFGMLAPWLQQRHGYVRVPSDRGLPAGICATGAMFGIR